MTDGVIYGWIKKEEIGFFVEMQDEARTRDITLSTFPMFKDDVPVKVLLNVEPERPEYDMKNVF